MDELFMKRCLELAALGNGHVAPNPMVGSVIVQDGQIIGEGFHENFGQPHAEANAITSVSDPSLLANATLYVNLEPCTHSGKTPACVDLITKSGIRKVVVGATDINEEVQGGGADHLRSNGCEVIEGVLESECMNLNRRFFTFHAKKRPYIILKWAKSADGYMAPANGGQHWISGDESKRLVHKWRAEEQAIMVGTNTVISDNPQLTTRLWEGDNPLRVTIDNGGRIPDDANILNGEADTLIYSGQAEDSKSAHVFIEAGSDQIKALLADLHIRGILSLIVEGGSQLLNSFIEAGLWDEARVFTGAENFRGGLKAPDLDIAHVDEERIGVDVLRYYFNK